ncbi:response regulator transcription factor [Helicobacter cappadocius]|uniref:Response regulator transcription factor n=1 Tax=Helicobacter cappadocius TaxID=3063998 RepID=A0AA90PL89_9HELI|nr:MULTISPECIES: response regulator transcription factor [unclassified Helicobacter]MDO7253607.1 response regulator transcription factor [Helicobacter sp. faydin-H75]MDP2539535.1 response regulator transcription factor [Helicobacter sp. faydin-H76]
MKDLILVIDDEEDLLELLEYRLEQEGFEVIGALGSKSARKILEEENVSLMLVDRNLGLEEGSEFVKKIRKEGYNIPVIYLSAKDSQEDKITGFQRGGDDYITKPFVFEELVARIFAVLRRYKGAGEEKIWKYKNITLYPRTHLLFTDDSENKIELTPLETKMLLVFLKNTGMVLSRDYLLEEIWNNQGESKSVNVAIKRLRKKLDSKDEERFIKAIRGEGYLFV